jgi:hypothetical protein
VKDLRIHACLPHVYLLVAPVLLGTRERGWMTPLFIYLPLTCPPFSSLPPDLPSHRCLPLGQGQWLLVIQNPPAWVLWRLVICHPSAMFAENVLKRVITMKDVGMTKPTEHKLKGKLKSFQNYLHPFQGSGVQHLNQVVSHE